MTCAHHAECGARAGAGSAGDTTVRELTRLDHPRRPGRARTVPVHDPAVGGGTRTAGAPPPGPGRSERQACASAGSPAAATATARLRLVSSAVQITEPAAKIAAAHQNAV